MSQDEVVQLMQSSRTEAEWNANADKVKAAFINPRTKRPDYPDFWYSAIIMSGVYSVTASKFNT